VIKITGSTRQTFSFPADLATAADFYRDFSRILHYLPHIHMVRAYGSEQFRVMYHTLELGVYRVRIYCDLQVRYDEASQTLHVAPLLNKPPVKSKATVRSLTTQGYFASQSVFRARGDHSVVDYQLSLEARLPRPLGLLLMPDKVIEQIASNITDWRIDEIASGFIRRSVHAYRRQATATASGMSAAGSAQQEWCPAAVVPQTRHAR
jgi:hypothetical protein